MISKFFILNLLSVTLVESASGALVAPERGGAVSTIQIICEKGGTDPIAKQFNTLSSKFNKLVTQYFAQNFGDGGKQYLEFVRTGAREGVKKERECVVMATDSSLARALTKEMEEIVSDLDPSSRTLSKKSKKGMDQVRFRVHRFLGILILCRNLSCLSDFLQIDYQKAFRTVKDSEELDKSLSKFQGSTVRLSKQVTTMVSDCLRRFGGATLRFDCRGNALEPVSHPCYLALEKYKELKCSDTKSGDSLVRAEICRLLPLAVAEMANSPWKSIGPGITYFFEAKYNGASLQEYLEGVLISTKPFLASCGTNYPKAPKLQPLKPIEDVVRRLIPFILHGGFSDIDQNLSLRQCLLLHRADISEAAISGTCRTLNLAVDSCIRELPVIE